MHFARQATTFPQYEETEQHIIGTVEQRAESFNANKLTVYKRNSLIIEQAALVDRETERRAREKEQTELAQTDERIRYNKFSRVFNRSAIAVVIGATCIIAFAAVKSNFNQKNYVQIAETAVYNYEVSETAAEKAEMQSETEAEVIVEMPEDYSQTEAVTVTTYLAAENTPLEAAEGQYLFNNENVSAVMELTSFLPVVTAESRGAEYSLDVNFTVKNISEESVDIVPSGFKLYNSAEEYVSAADYSLKKLPDHYALESGAAVNFKLSYRAETEYLQNAVGVKYVNDTTGIYNDSAANGMAFAPSDGNLLSAEQAAELAKAAEENKSAESDAITPFSENDGGYIINDENISYAVSIEALDGNTVAAHIKARRLNDSGYFVFPSSFMLGGDIIGGSGTVLKRPVYFSFDKERAEETVYSGDKVSGFDGQLYDDPVRLYFNDDSEISFSLIYDITPDAYNNAEFNKFYISSEKYVDVSY